MNGTKPTNNTLSWFQPAIDSMCFIGAGILAKSYSIRWMNDPTTKSGIAILGSLNAIALCITNHYVKTNEKTSLLDKIVLTVGTLYFSVMATALGTLYFSVIATKLPTNLTNRFNNIVLTPQLTVGMAGLNLIIKIVILGISMFPPRPTESPPPEENNDSTYNSSSQPLLKYYNFYKTVKGKQEWLTLSSEFRSALLTEFFENNLPFFEFDNLTLKTIDFSNRPSVIKNYTKNQALWVHKIISSRANVSLSSDALQAYIKLFYKNDLPPFSHELGIFKLPRCYIVHQVNSLTTNQVKWHHLLTKNLGRWPGHTIKMSLEVQNAFNQRFFACGQTTFPLFAYSIAEILETSELIIRELASTINRDDGLPFRWIEYSRVLQEVLNEKFNQFGIISVPYAIHPEHVHEVDLLDNTIIRAYHKSIKDNFYIALLFSSEVQIAFSKRFSALQLDHPSIYWKAEPPKPEPIATFENYPEKLVLENNRHCWFCYCDPDPTKPREWVIHTINGESHPLHKDCAIGLYVVKTDSIKCCNSLLNRLSLIPLLSLKERVGLFLHQNKNQVIKALALGIIIVAPPILGALIAPRFAALQETVGVGLFELITFLAQSILSKPILPAIYARIELVVGLAIGGAILLQKAYEVVSIFTELTVWDIATVGGVLYSGTQLAAVKGFATASLGLLAIAKAIKEVSLSKGAILGLLSFMNIGAAIENIRKRIDPIEQELRERESIEHLSQHLLTSS